MIRFFLKLIFEVTVAVILFFVLVKYTNLFGTDLLNFSPEQKVSILSTHAIKVAYYKQQEKTEHTSAEAQQRCQTPRGTTIAHNQSLSLYQPSTNENVCEGVLVICNNGEMNIPTGYTLQECSYEIDGIKNGKEVIAGASSTTSRIVIPVQRIDQKYIQPATNSQENFYVYNLNGQRVDQLPDESKGDRDNSKNSRENYNPLDLIEL